MATNPTTPPRTRWIGGYEWNPLRVDWTIGAEGAWRKHSGPGRPRVGHDLWSTTLKDASNIGDAIYALHRSSGTVYGGRGSVQKGGPQLPARLRSHWLTDELQHKWTSFTWIAENPHATATTPPGIDFLELVALRMANPPHNRQMPTLPDQITWLVQVDQVDPDNAEVSERVFRLL